MHSSLFLSQTDARPMYLQIVEQIRQRVAAGDWPAGLELPSIRALAADLRVSVITVKRAYLDLKSEGVIVTRHGKGSFVADAQGLAKDMRLAHLPVVAALQVGVGNRALHRGLKYPFVVAGVMGGVIAYLPVLVFAAGGVDKFCWIDPAMAFAVLIGFTVLCSGVAVQRLSRKD